MGGFPRELRLRRRSDFVRVQRQGRRTRTPDLVVAVLPNVLTHPRFGITVSKKVGNAVARNRVKRHLREAIRAGRGALTGVDVVFIARPSAALASGEVLGQQVCQVLTRLQDVGRH